MYFCPDPIDEDKKCRICGYADKENINIFCMTAAANRSCSINLFTKVTTVYPIVLYENDPLPKNICRKCINSVNHTYNDIQRVMKQQQRWIENVRAMQPENKYLRILDAIENSIKVTKDSLKVNHQVDIKEETVKKILIKPEEGIEEDIKPGKYQPLNENFVKDIKSKLELNGCTVKKIKVTPTLPENTDEDPLHYEESVSPTSPEIVSCQYCPYTGNDLKKLAEHQLGHLSIPVDKIFQKRILPTHLRRGRLIEVNSQKSIRCLNCWRIFDNNKAILTHWYQGDCDYYCFLCGKEFPQAPKMLREHVAAAHGISYRSVKRQSIIARGSPRIPSSTEETRKQPVATKPFFNHSMVGTSKLKKVKGIVSKAAKNINSPTVCPICHINFSNWRSRNSHMRKHKPSVKYGEVVLPPDSRKDKYAPLDKKSNPSASMLANNTQRIGSHHQMKPGFRIITKNGPIPGIRTKFVQRRSDLLYNYSSSFHDKPSTSTFMCRKSTSDIYSSTSGPLMKSQQFTYDVNLGHTKSEQNQTIIKEEPTETEEDDRWNCFTCHATFNNLTEFERHTMYAHNPNFEW
uniref:ZAD domain-containing protein n=1 Tax=Glossina austeni TaxID=7395 RepID=A0A1A9UWW7_GLOAU